MVKVDLFRNKDGALVGFKALGHSGYAPHGEDIVCASVSALLITAVIGLHSRLKLSPRVKTDEDSGFLQCMVDIESLEDAVKHRMADILETVVLGLIEIEKEYEQYLSVKEVII